MIAVICVAGHMLLEVDPTTRKTTGRVQQFKGTTTKDGNVELKPLPRDLWVENPKTLSVDRHVYR